MQQNAGTITAENKQDFLNLADLYYKGVTTIGNEGRIAERFIEIFAAFSSESGHEPFTSFTLMGEVIKVLLNNPDMMQKFPDHCKTEIGSLLTGLQTLLHDVSENKMLTSAIHSEVRSITPDNENANAGAIFTRERDAFYKTDHMAQKANETYWNENDNNKAIKELEDKLGLAIPTIRKSTENFVFN